MLSGVKQSSDFYDEYLCKVYNSMKLLFHITIVLPTFAQAFYRCSEICVVNL